MLNFPCQSLPAEYRTDSASDYHLYIGRKAQKSLPPQM